MTTWFSFLATQGAVCSTGEYPTVTSFGETPADYPQLQSQDLLFALDDCGVMSVSGPDSDTLLQGQVTCDIHQLSEQQYLKGALCTVKGRMVSSFYLARQKRGATLLISHRGLIGTTLERLKKFAVFYKTTLIDLCDDYRLLGLAGPNAAALAQQLTGQQITTPENCLQGEGMTLLRVGPQRWLAVVPADTAESLWQQLSEHATAAGLPLWHLLTIGEGEGHVSPATSEVFIPQMLNYQDTGAVNFKKGCYTGQEIVARMQYLGKLKRRMYRLAVAGQPSPAGSAIGLPGGRECGTVVSTAPATDGQWQLLAVLTDDAAAEATLSFDDEALAVSVLSLPYDPE